MKTYKMQQDQYPNQQQRFLPYLIFVAMLCSLLLIDAVLPLRDLQFVDALLTHVAQWTTWPTNILFPHQPITAFMYVIPPNSPPTIVGSWKRTALLFVVFLSVFLLYVLALRLLPKRINHRYILISTLLLGLLCVLIPIVTSSDVYSYIAYARIGAMYHLNPLTTLPKAIHFDPVYRRIRWLDQPSAYGPTWAIITCSLQWLANTVGLVGILAMLMILRLFALVMHLSSCWLIWSISGHLQSRYGFISPEKRLLALLAFAWNPLLLLEACVNAHNDATLIFFVLVAIWFLARTAPITTRTFVLAAALLALATCLKLYIILLIPGLLLFLWTQPNRIQKTIAVLISYFGIILLLYAPFWHDGAILDLFLVNPAANRNINSPAEFLAYLFNGIYYAIAKATGHPLIAIYIGSPAEHVAHALSLVAFIILYGLLCWRTFRAPYRIDTLPALIRWLATAWLLYCFIGSPWFWPWYAVTFFGLYGLIESLGDRTGEIHHAPGFLDQPLVAPILTFSLLTLYCFFGWGPMNSAVIGLPLYLWAYLRGLWVWALPLLAILVSRKPGITSRWQEQGKDMRRLIQQEMTEASRQFAVLFATVWREIRPERKSSQV